VRKEDKACRRGRGRAERSRVDEKKDGRKLPYTEASTAILPKSATLNVQCS